jgi:hypothetical protein
MVIRINCFNILAKCVNSDMSVTHKIWHVVIFIQEKYSIINFSWTFGANLCLHNASLNSSQIPMTMTWFALLGTSQSNSSLVWLLFLLEFYRMLDKHMSPLEWSNGTQTGAFCIVVYKFETQNKRYFTVRYNSVTDIMWLKKIIAQDSQC